MKNLCKLLLSAVGFLFLLEGCNNSSNNTVESSYEANSRKSESGDFVIEKRFATPVSYNQKAGFSFF